MKISSHYLRTNPKRVLCYKTAALCGNATASRLYKMIQLEKINEAKNEIKKIPDRKVVTWGEGQQMGMFVAKGKQGSRFIHQCSNFLLFSRYSARSRCPRDSCRRWRLVAGIREEVHYSSRR